MTDTERQQLESSRRALIGSLKSLNRVLGYAPDDDRLPVDTGDPVRVLNEAIGRADQAIASLPPGVSSTR